MKKRWMTMMLAVAIVFICCTATKAQAAKYSVNTSGNTMKAGEEIMVTVSLNQTISKEKGATMLQGELDYDESALTYKSFSLHDNYKHLTCVNSKKASVFLFNWLSDTSKATGFHAGNMIKVIFTAKTDIAVSDVNAKINLGFVLQNARGEDVEADTTVYICAGHKWKADKMITAPTCVKDGTMSYVCACGETKTDVIKATGNHPWGTPFMVQAASYGSDGYYMKACACGAIEKADTIAGIASVKLSATSYTYNKKAKKPSVTVKDSMGNTLKNGTDYKVTYAKGRKNIGQYKVTVAFAGEYTGTQTLKFSIVPKGTKISSVKAGKKKVTLKWKKQALETKGYQIQYGLKKNMKGAKTKLVKKNKTTSLTISKLKSKKTYYLRIRTYKEVKVNGKKTKLYSSWSSVRKVKVK